MTPSQSRRVRAFEPPWCWPSLRMHSKSSFSRYSSKELCRPLMTYSISVSAAVLVYLLGWHWEFLPSFLAKLVPGVDLVPFWTLAVANVYRKAKRMAEAPAADEQPPQLPPPHFRKS